MWFKHIIDVSIKPNEMILNFYTETIWFWYKERAPSSGHMSILQGSYTKTQGWANDSSSYKAFEDCNIILLVENVKPHLFKLYKTFKTTVFS